MRPLSDITPVQWWLRTEHWGHLAALWGWLARMGTWSNYSPVSLISVLKLSQPYQLDFSKVITILLFISLKIKPQQYHLGFVDEAQLTRHTKVNNCGFHGYSLSTSTHLPFLLFSMGHKLIFPVHAISTTSMLHCWKAIGFFFFFRKNPFLKICSISLLSHIQVSTSWSSWGFLKFHPCWSKSNRPLEGTDNDVFIEYDRCLKLQLPVCSVMRCQDPGLSIFPEPLETLLSCLWV